MRGFDHIGVKAIVCCLALGLLPAATSAQSNANPPNAPAVRDGQHDFDFEIGKWKTHLKRLVHPLTGSTSWVEYDGTSAVRKVWNGRANLLELEVDGPAGHIEGLSLRLYNPDSRQWSLNFSNSAGGSLGQPAIGEFKAGRGEFYDQETLGSRAILVRFVISDITADSCHFEQAFSDDGGKTWEVNWIADDTRVKEESSGSVDGATSHPNSPPAASNREARADAWWTGPLVAPNASTLPRGHLLVEPYFYDIIGPHSNGFGSLTYINYGLAEGWTVGLLPTVGHNQVENGPSTAGVGMGDLTAQLQYRLTNFQEGSWVPTTSINVQEGFPTGKYDRLGERTSDGFGSGAYTTTVSFYSQTFFWMPNGRILRARFNVAQALPSNASVEGASVYDTGTNFSGHAQPGRSTLVDLAGEYSLTQRWVLAMDVIYRRTGNTSVTGRNLPNPATVQTNLGTADTIGFAPAVEYNWKSTIGVIVGTRVLTGHNTTKTVTPALAINYVH
ncbi:MAG TPA: hypothetical protein VEG64_13040 [Candidatus Sulfotelmatobacter sp.]|nr:hypothetical protein [Candidatus Sulfotelmatobacter sp.]